MEPKEFVRFIDRFFGTDRPMRIARHHLGFGGEDAAWDVAQSCYLALRGTAAAKVDSGESFWMTTSDEAERYALRALSNTANRQLRGMIGDEQRRGPVDATLELRDVGEASVGPLPKDPQQVLDRVAIAVQDAVVTGDLGRCPGCGRPKLLGLSIASVEGAREALDPEYEEDDLASRAQVDDLSKAIYRAIARVSGRDAVVGADDRLKPGPRKLLSRCRPCVEQILDDVVRWLLEAPADWIDAGGPR